MTDNNARGTAVTGATQQHEASGFEDLRRLVDEAP